MSAGLCTRQNMYLYYHCSWKIYRHTHTHKHTHSHRHTQLLWVLLCPIFTDLDLGTLCLQPSNESPTCRSQCPLQNDINTQKFAELCLLIVAREQNWDAPSQDEIMHSSLLSRPSHPRETQYTTTQIKSVNFCCAVIESCKFPTVIFGKVLFGTLSEQQYIRSNTVNCLPLYLF